MRHNRDIFRIFLNMKVGYVFSLESPHRGDTTFNILKKISLNYPKSAAIGFFQGGKRAISVRSTEVILYITKNI